MVHATSAAVASNSRWKVSSATETTVMSRIDMMAPRTTTPATIRTPLSSLSEELSGCVSPDWSSVSVTPRGYWLPPTTTQSFSSWAGSLRAYAVEVLDPRQAGAAHLLDPPRRSLDLTHHAQGVAAGQPREVVGGPAAVGE